MATFYFYRISYSKVTVTLAVFSLELVFNVPPQE